MPSGPFAATVQPRACLLRCLVVERFACQGRLEFRPVSAGVYDVHSPVVPTAEAMVKKLQSFLPALGKGYDTHRMWVNPDCGLKTREWQQVRCSHLRPLH